MTAPDDLIRAARAALLSCPFCGSDDCEEIEGDRNAGQSGDWCAIRCGKCEAEGPHVWDFPKAIAAWNRRAARMEDKP